MGLTTTIQIKPIFLLTLWKHLSRSAVNHGEWFVELNILVQQVDKETQCTGPCLKLLAFSQLVEAQASNIAMLPGWFLKTYSITFNYLALSFLIRAQNHSHIQYHGRVNVPSFTVIFHFKRKLYKRSNAY